RGGGEWVAFSPDGRTLAISGTNGRVELWDVATRRELRELKDPTRKGLATVAFSPDGRVVAAGSQEANHITTWQVKTGRLLGRPIVVRPRGSSAQWLAFSPDSKRIAVPGDEGTVGIRDVATGRAIGKPLSIGSADVDDAVFADGGRTIIAGDDSGAVSFVD